MARSQYIYLIRLKVSGRLLAGFTVKGEARTWAERKSGRQLEAMQLLRMRDGVTGDKTEVPTSWD